MNIEDIKVGETYNVRVKVTLKTSESITAETVDKNGRFLCENEFAEEETAAFSPIAASIGYMKYDPCRLFRKGDRVKTRSVFGRKIYIDDALYEVMWDESCNKISVKDLTSAETLVGMPSVFFELVTPVEEMEPYYVEEQDSYYVVGKRQEAPEMEYVAGFSKTRHPNAKAAAEAERDRLNEAWRKEQSND